MQLAFLATSLVVFKEPGYSLVSREAAQFSLTMLLVSAQKPHIMTEVHEDNTSVMSSVAVRLYF